MLVYHTPADINPELPSSGCVVVIDVLRATSTIVTALHHGCRKIIPVSEISQAWAMAEEKKSCSFLMAGERKGRIIKDFDLGNSPSDFTVEKVRNKSIVLTTSNGTRALKRCDLVQSVLICSLLNVQAVSECLKFQDPENTIILCAGSDNQPSLEDSVCAGLLIKNLASLRTVPLGEGCEYALSVARRYGSDVHAMLHAAPHGRFLQSIGFGRDLDDCARLNSFKIVPRYRNRVIKAMPCIDDQSWMN
ncbi:2-phosphosulfolactate phosphatase [candidate division KSB1 bacterium]|nr:2-phosphosulfolactate phosphatase [candidate division KSB1 bacterium]